MVRSWVRGLAAVPVVITLGLVSTIPSYAQRAGPTWQAVQTPSAQPPASLADVEAQGVRSAWAVGSEGSPSIPLIVHWNGRRWVKQPSPGWQGTLTEVTTAPDGTWASGVDQTTGAAKLLRRIGSVWAPRGFPRSDDTTLRITGLSALPGGRLWLSATYGSPTTSMLAFYDGRIWTETPLPVECATGCAVQQVEARGPGDAWAVGTAAASSAAVATGIALRWDGTAWTARLPDGAGGVVSLNDVHAVSSGDVWAVGHKVVFNVPRPYSATVVLHYDGTSWQDAGAPEVVGSGVSLAAGGDGLWVSVQLGAPGLAGTARYLRHASGMWTVVNGPAIPGADAVTTRAVAAVPGTSVTWSVGHRASVAAQTTLPHIELSRPPVE
ncbi:hypothetical protein FHS43_000410 [Streptosporangium becharense]|uniref:Uncharacterized protein n=1 Tax=Streptosporangium becharense TaxID=1816182 RepID=A0A7W9IFQ0_9ACTN|nr:hypothetical protein [Streptosporangium becharense]MBB2909164.1 hypothetical protein [Streptosporangium becharense]MBB5819817.1 hypothetical protein [Streptosporangium becharense]